MNDEYRSLTNERLNNLISETQESLDELKEELARRKRAEQEYEIAHLEDHMHSAELSLKTIRNFLTFLTANKGTPSKET